MSQRQKLRQILRQGQEMGRLLRLQEEMVGGRITRDQIPQPKRREPVTKGNQSDQPGRAAKAPL